MDPVLLFQYQKSEKSHQQVIRGDDCMDKKITSTFTAETYSTVSHKLQIHVNKKEKSHF